MLIALGSVCAGLAAYLVADIANSLAAVGLPALELSVAVGGLAALAGALWLLIAARMGVPLAFRMDRLANLGQRYGTALGLAARGDDGSAVQRSLLAAAQADERAIREQGLDRPLTGPIAGAAAAAVVLGALIAFSPAMVATLNQPVPAPAPESQTMTDDLLASASAAAELMALDAERRDNRYLANVAQALQARLDALAEGDDPELLRQEIEDLLAHAQQAYGSAVPQWLGQGDDRLAGLDERIAQHHANLAEAEARRASTQDPGAMEVARQDDYGARIIDSDQLQMANTLAEAANAENRIGDAQMELEETSNGLRPMDMASLPQMSGGQSIGASQQSGRGLSDAAGLGSETLEEDADFARIDGVAATEEMLIETMPNPGGRRIRMEIVPEAGESAAGDGFGMGAIAAGSAPGAVNNRQFVPADRIAVTARYFARAPQ